MNKVYYFILALTLLFVDCSQGQKPVSERSESRESKRLLQGVWLDESTESVVFQMKGDTIYFADSTSMPAYFKVIDDTLYIGSTGSYYIEKQTEHVLWFKNHSGETAKYVKSDDEEMNQMFEQSKPQILTLTEVLKRDTVVFHNNERYHIYIAINPTKYKVSHHVLNNDGLDVENIYYDNIIHLSIFHGAAQIFSRDFRKSLYNQKVPSQVLSQSILNNMVFDKCDEDGLHFRTSICVPDDASCYMVGHTVSYKGQLTTQLLEY